MTTKHLNINSFISSLCISAMCAPMPALGTTSQGAPTMDVTHRTAPNACKQIFAMHEASKLTNARGANSAARSTTAYPQTAQHQHAGELPGNNSILIDRHLNAVVKELAQLTMAINQAIAIGNSAEAAVLRGHLVERFKKALALGIDLDAYETLIKNNSNADKKLAEVQTLKDQMDRTREQTKRSERHLLPWVTLKILNGHTNMIRSVAFSPDGSRVVTASSDNTAKIWNASTGEFIATLNGHKKSVRSANFSPDSSRIVSGSLDKRAIIWDTITGLPIATLTGHINEINVAAFSPDGLHILTADDRAAKIWDAINGKSIATLRGHTDLVLSANFGSDGVRIVTASSDRTAKIWDAINGKSIAILSGHTDLILSANFSSDGTRIVTASNDHTVRIWDASSGAHIGTLNGHTGPVYSANFSPDGSRIVTASEDKTARTWDAITGNPIATLIGHTNLVTSAAFSSDGSRIVTGSADKSARIWTQIENDKIDRPDSTQLNSSHINRYEFEHHQ